MTRPENKKSLQQAVKELDFIKPWSAIGIWREFVSAIGLVGASSSLLFSFQVIDTKYQTPNNLLKALLCVVAYVIIRRAIIQANVWHKSRALLPVAIAEIEEHRKKVNYWFAEYQKTSRRMEALEATEPILLGLANQYFHILSYLNLSPEHRRELEEVFSKLASTREGWHNVTKANESSDDSQSFGSSYHGS